MTHTSALPIHTRARTHTPRVCMYLCPPQITVTTKPTITCGTYMEDFRKPRRYTPFNPDDDYENNKCASDTGAGFLYPLVSTDWADVKNAAMPDTCVYQGMNMMTRAPRWKEAPLSTIHNAGRIAAFVAACCVRCSAPGAPESPYLHAVSNLVKSDVCTVCGVRVWYYVDKSLPAAYYGWLMKPGTVPPGVSKLLKSVVGPKAHLVLTSLEKDPPDWSMYFHNIMSTIADTPN